MNSEIPTHDYAALADERLLALVGAGDRAAFSVLYERFAPRMFGLLVKLLRNRDHAEDVLQTVSLDVWRRADRYDPALGSAATWLLMVTRARAIDALRGSARRVPTRSDQSDVQAPMSAEKGAENFEGSTRSPQLAAAIELLPSEQRTAVELAFYRGLTREEIAESLRIPVGTVKTRIRSAVRRLGAALGVVGSDVGEEGGNA